MPDLRTPAERLAALRDYANKGPAVSRSDCGWVVREMERLLGQETGTEWPLRGRDAFTAADFMDELRRYARDCDHISCRDVEWAHEMITELVGLVRGFEAATAVLRDEHRHAPRQ